jgi:hypothetical protein
MMPDALAFFAGGVVGTVTMSTITVSLYGHHQPSLWGLLGCAVAGGLLAVASQQVGLLFDPRAGSNPTPALFVGWQTGTGALLGWLWPLAKADDAVCLSIVASHDELPNHRRR